MKTGIFYGSTTGNCEHVAKEIAKKLGVADADVKTCDQLSQDAVADYELLLLGSSTWGAGDLQDDWYSAVETLGGMNLAGKKVAVFGTGDSASYSDTFCNAIAQIYDAAEKAGATMTGNNVSTDGYDYSDSEAVRNGAFIGLACDEDNQPDLTEERIANWVATL